MVPVCGNAEKYVMQQPGSSIALLFGCTASSSGTAEKSTRYLRDEKHGAPVPVNAENCSLACRTRSGTYSVIRDGKWFIEERHISSALMGKLAKALARKTLIEKRPTPSAFVAQPANAMGCCP